MPWSEQANLLLRKAQQDGLLVEHMVSFADIGPELFGLHVQQACEKAMKAVLSVKGIAFRRTHNLQELSNLLVDGHVPFPESLSELVAWSPFAVTYRYEEWIGEEPFERSHISSLTQSVLSWASEHVNNGDSVGVIEPAETGD